MKKKYIVSLDSETRNQLEQLTTAGVESARKLNRARVLLLADINREDGGLTDQQINQVLGVSTAAIGRIRQRFVEQGLTKALNEKPRSGRPRKFSSYHRAQITALACSTPPEGHEKWSLRLLADKAVELDFVETISYKSVRAILKKTNFPLT